MTPPAAAGGVRFHGSVGIDMSFGIGSAVHAGAPSATKADFGDAAPLRDLLAVPPQPTDRADYGKLTENRRLADLLTASRMAELLRAGRRAQRWNPARAIDQIDGAASWCDAVEAAHSRYGLPLHVPFLLRVRRFAAVLPSFRALILSRDTATDPGKPETAFRIAAAMAAPLRAQAMTDRTAWIANVRASRGEPVLWHLDRATDLLAAVAEAYDIPFADIEALAQPFSVSAGARFPLAVDLDGFGARIQVARLFLLADEETPVDGRLPLVRLGLPARDSRLDDGTRRGVVAGLDAFNRMRLRTGQRPVGLVAGFYDIGDPGLDAERGDSQVEAALMTATLSVLSGRPFPPEALITGRLKTVDHRISGVSSRVDAALRAGCRRFLLPGVNRAEIESRAASPRDDDPDHRVADAHIGHVQAAGGFLWFDAAESVAGGWRKLMTRGGQSVLQSTTPENRMPGLVRLAARLVRAAADPPGTARLEISLAIGRQRLALPTGEVQLALNGLRLVVAIDGGRIDAADLSFTPDRPDPGRPAGGTEPSWTCLAGPASPLDETPQPSWRITATRAGAGAAWEIAGDPAGSALESRLGPQRFAVVRITGDSPRIEVRAEMLPRFLMVEEAAGLMGPEDGRNKLIAVRLLLWKLLAGRLGPHVSRATLTAEAASA